MKKILIPILFVILFASIQGKDEKIPVRLFERLNGGIHSTRIGHSTRLHEYCRYLPMGINWLLNDLNHLKPEVVFDQGIPMAERIDIPYNVVTDPDSGGKGNISVAGLVEIDDKFSTIFQILEIDGQIYFILDYVKTKNSKTRYGIYKMNREGWFDFITGTNFEWICPLENGRILGFRPYRPRKLHSFRKNFQLVSSIVLKDFRYRQEIYCLDKDHFIFHNARMDPRQYAIEVYHHQKGRVGEFFTKVPIQFRNHEHMALLGQTRCATDRRGKIYMAFQFPRNPYRIFELNREGKVLRVFGHHLGAPDKYGFPFELMKMTWQSMEEFGVKKVVTIDRILVDEGGNILVFWCRHRIPRKYKGKYNHQVMVDIYNYRGEFLTRRDFPYGIPEAIDFNGRIYAKKYIDRDRDSIIVSRINGLN